MTRRRHRGTTNITSAQAADMAERGACLVPMVILAIVSLIIAGVSIADPKATWIEAYTSLPVRNCINGTKVLDRDGFTYYTSCNKYSSSPSTDTFYVQVGPYRSANIYHYSSGVIISTVAWSDLTSENLCNPNSDVSTKYGAANNLCKADGTLNFVNNPFPTFVGGIVGTSFAAAVVLFGMLLCCMDKGAKRYITLLLFSLTAVIGIAFALGFWTTFSVTTNYFNTQIQSYAPMWNVSLSSLGPVRNSAGRVVTAYTIDYGANKTLIASPPIRSPRVTSALASMVPLLILLSLVTVFSAYTVVNAFRVKNQKPSTSVPPQTFEQTLPGGVPLPPNISINFFSSSQPQPTEAIPTAVPIAEPVGEPASFANFDPEYPAKAGDQEDVQRPTRPAPPPADITLT